MHLFHFLKPPAYPKPLGGGGVSVYNSLSVAHQSPWDEETSLLLYDAQEICWQIQVEGSPQREPHGSSGSRGAGLTLELMDGLPVLASPPQLSGAGKRWCWALSADPTFLHGVPGFCSLPHPSALFPFPLPVHLG